jgi:hypothetical protein
MNAFVSLGSVADSVLTQLASRRFAEPREADYLRLGERGPDAAGANRPGQVARRGREVAGANSDSVLSRGKPNCGLRQMVGSPLPPGSRLPLLR